MVIQNALSFSCGVLVTIYIVLLLLPYVLLSMKRWQYARHYGQGFRLLAPSDFREGYALMSMVKHGRQWRMLLIAALAVYYSGLIYLLASRAA